MEGCKAARAVHTNSRPKGLETCNTQRHAAQRNAIHHTKAQHCTHSHTLSSIGEQATLRLDGMETTIKSKPQMLEGAAQGGAGGVGRQST